MRNKYIYEKWEPDNPKSRVRFLDEASSLPPRPPLPSSSILMIELIYSFVLFWQTNR
jgi:hypothetical protein